MAAGALTTPSLEKGPAGGPTSPPGERRATLFYTAEVHGAVEPCGCTSDPLGDISRLSALVAEARKEERRGDGGNSRSKAGAKGESMSDANSTLKRGPRAALLDAGGLLYPEGKISPKERPSADLRAEFLAAEFGRIGLLGAALAETDAASGVARVRPARLASNMKDAPSALVRSPRVENVGGIAVGVLGISDPAVANLVNATTEEMLPAARRDVEGLRKAGAELVVLLAAVEKTGARKLARDSGADIIILGKRVGAGTPRLERVGRAYIAAPAEEMQRVGRLDIVLRRPPGAVTGTALDLQDAGGPEAARLRREEIDKALARLRSSLSQWSGKAAAPGAASNTGKAGDNSPVAVDQSVDEVFLATKKQEVRELEAEKKRLEVPWAAPPTGDYLVNTLVPLRRSLPRDPQVVARMKKLDQRIAAVNLRQATPPPPAEAGRAFFVGTDKCTSCHLGATKFWKQTVHAHAWKTLVDGGKQADYKCVGCHVTGWGQVGGTTLGFTKKLESVQCETCHGPGSLHVAGEGNEEPLAIKRDTPESVCLDCHTVEHSDTFKYDAYMRDVLGPGHGLKRRTALGDGPTGRELRSAALAKAKLAGAAQKSEQKLKKM